MTFPSNTYLKVIGYLDKTIADADEVKAALNTAEATPEVEAEVTEVLEKLATLEANLYTEQSSPNSAMIRADVIEWQPGQRSKGLNTSLSSYKQRLANLIGLTWVKPNSGTGICGPTTVQTRTIL